MRSDERSITPLTGETMDGVPLSLNRAPAADLAPWISRLMVALVETPDDFETAGQLCNDAAYVRTAVEGQWAVEMQGGELPLHNETFLCGQHSHVMPLKCTGHIKVAGFMLRPGAMRHLFGAKPEAMVDRIVGMDEVGVADRELTGLYRSDIGAEEWLLAIECWLRDWIDKSAPSRPDPISQRLEEAAFADPNQSLADFAEANDITLRTLQRSVKRDFGLTPKQVMRRARTLDMAARICGVADEAEEADFLLRFFDDSHLIREFTGFFGTTPTRFAAERNSILTLSLEIRQSRRLETLERIAPDAVRPWMRAPFQPPLVRSA